MQIPASAASFSTWIGRTSTAFQFRGKCHSSAKQHLSYSCKWESGRRDDGSDGQAQPSPPGWFIKRLSAGGALRLDWKAPAGQRGQPAPEVRWYMLEPEQEATHETNPGYRRRRLFQSLPSILLLGLFIKGKGNSTIFKAERDPQPVLMLNGLFSSVPITANTVVLLLERCVHVLTGSFLGQTADREAN